MSKNKSVLILGINFYPEPTGIGKYTGEFAFFLAENGYDVKVITSYPYYPYWKIFAGYKNLFFKSEKINGVSIIRCPIYVPTRLSGLRRMLQDFSFFISSFLAITCQLFRFKKYQTVFIPSPSFMSGFLGIYYRFFYRKSKVIYHIQDLQIDAAEELNMIRVPKLLGILKKLEGFILEKSDLVTTISIGMLAKIRAKQHAPKAIYVFPNWVDFDKIYAKEADVSQLSHLGFPLDKKMVFYSGAVGEKQGLEMLLDVSRAAMHTLSDVIFVIAGTGSFLDILTQKVSEESLSNFYFIDLQPLNIFNELMNHAFLHLVIQKDKAANLLLPSKLTNILAVGGLSIVTASPETTLYDIVYENKIGIVVPPENSEAFYNALLKIYNNPESSNEIRKNAASYAKKNLQKENIINDFLVEADI